MSCPESYVPKWSLGNTRDVLPQLVLNVDAELKMKSGVYGLTVKYNIIDTPNQALHHEDGIVIGEVEFSSNGFAMAEGADWDRLLSEQRQTKLPYDHGARGMPMWMRAAKYPSLGRMEMNSSFRLIRTKTQSYSRRAICLKKSFGTSLLLQYKQSQVSGLSSSLLLFPRIH